jgi:hypothetical protein
MGARPRTGDNPDLKDNTPFSMGNRSSSSEGTTTATTTNMVKYVESDGEWMELMEQSKEKLVVVDFTASW